MPDESGRVGQGRSPRRWVVQIALSGARSCRNRESGQGALADLASPVDHHNAGVPQCLGHPCLGVTRHEHGAGHEFKVRTRGGSAAHRCGRLAGILVVEMPKQVGPCAHVTLTQEQLARPTARPARAAGRRTGRAPRGRCRTTSRCPRPPAAVPPRSRTPQVTGLDITTAAASTAWARSRSGAARRSSPTRTSCTWVAWSTSMFSAGTSLPSTPRRGCATA